MNVEPYQKKARTVKDALSDMPVGSIFFTPELIAWVATFAKAVVRPVRGVTSESDVKNMCLAVGPIPSRTIKHYYLKKNMQYLKNVLEVFTHHRDSAEWARECHLAWMSINTGWRSLVTDELMERNENPKRLIFDDFMERYENARHTGDMSHVRSSTLPLNIHPLLAMLNPAVAIEMGLLEALKHLVEVKGIDINATQWGGLRSGDDLHLIVTAIRKDDHEAFQYLMSVDTIDIYSMKRDYPATSRRRSSIFSYAIDKYIEDEKKKRFFEAFVKHAKFRANARSFTSFDPNDPDNDVSVTCLHHLVHVVLRQRGMAELVRVVDAVKYVLDAGADPNIELHDLMSPLELAILHEFGGEYAWQVEDTLGEIVRIMSNRSDS